MKTVIAVALVLVSASALACQVWTTTTVRNGKIINCHCTDCGTGPVCHCF